MDKEFDEFEELDIEKTISEETEFLDKQDFEVEDEDDDYSEVLKLTEYDGGLMSENSNIVAEYNNIKIVEIQNRHKIEAKSFVSKISKFISDFNDVELTDEHKKYLKQVASFQFEHLSDLLSLTSINKEMMNNIVLRINSVQAEDYAMIQSYNTLLNQHLKLIKELQNTYKGIPGAIKKMRTEILCNQELGDLDNNVEGLITENYGTTQFNDGKNLLKSLRDEYMKNEANK